VLQGSVRRALALSGELSFAQFGTTAGTTATVES
jgi:hypothetical protein